MSPSTEITATLSPNLNPCALPHTHIERHTHAHTRSSSAHKGTLQFYYEPLLPPKNYQILEEIQLKTLLNVSTFFTSDWSSQHRVEGYSCSKEECSDSGLFVLTGKQFQSFPISSPGRPPPPASAPRPRRTDSLPGLHRRLLLRVWLRRGPWELVTNDLG